MATKFPPGPVDWTFGLSFMQNLKYRLMETYEGLHRDYGDRVCCRIGPFQFFLFFHPDDVREVLVAHSKTILRDPRPLKVFAQWNGNSLLIAEGEDWVRQRRLVQPAFQSRRFAGYVEKMAIEVDELKRSLASDIAHRGYADVNIDQTMTTLTLDIICQTLFSTDMKSQAREIARAVATLSEIAFFEMQALFIWPRWLPTKWNRRKNEAMQILDRVVWDLIHQRRKENIDKGDLLSMLLSAVDEEGDGGSLTDEQVRNEAMTLMLAGHDTSAAALDWLWMLLAKHPHVCDRCRSELQTVCGDRAPVYADLSMLTYLNAVVKESLRLYPPAIGVFLRKATEDVTIAGYSVPKGSLIALSSLVTQRDARWFPDPMQFDPERFLPPRVDSIPHNAWFPFGAGPRICIGQSFAMAEMMLITARLLQHFRVSMVPGQAEPVPVVTAALRPKDPLWLRFELKSPDSRDSK
ncbi:MAG: cytochrome P450 [Fuerstia sp.]|nr:cytochrome P450 [Fuerstiella sp.]